MATLNPSNTKSIMFDTNSKRYILAGESRSLFGDPRMHRQLNAGQVAVSVFDNVGEGNKGEDHYKDYFVITIAGNAGDNRTTTFWGRIGNKHQSKRVGTYDVDEVFVKRSKHGYSYRGTVVLTGAETTASLIKFLETGNYSMKKSPSRYPGNITTPVTIAAQNAQIHGFYIWADDGEDAVI